MFRFTLLLPFALGVGRAASHLDHTPWLHVFVDWKSDLKMAVTGSDDGF